jgi:hypothetical protein
MDDQLEIRRPDCSHWLANPRPIEEQQDFRRKNLTLTTKNVAYEDLSTKIDKYQISYIFNNSFAM